MTGRGAAIAAALTAGVGTAFGALASGASSAPVAHSAACTPVTNIETIIDDSGSMAITDSHKLRVQGVDLLIDALPSSTQMGAIEFGGSFSASTPAADTLFPPRPVGANAAADKSVLDQKINADNGTTDYNAAFAQAQADNPTAKARIFLTDGGHDAGAYMNGHRGGPPTYVVGFGSSASGAGAALLKQIASETGGRYFPQTDSSKLQSVFDSIGALLTCHSLPAQYNDQFSRVGQAKTHSYSVPKGFRRLNFALSWADTSSRFNLGIIGSGYRAGAARLHVTRRSGSTYLLVTVTGVPKGRLKFSVRASRLGKAGAARRVITQITRSRR
jgi:hypothetical protein